MHNGVGFLKSSRDTKVAWMLRDEQRQVMNVIHEWWTQLKTMYPHGYGNLHIPIVHHQLRVNLPCSTPSARGMRRSWLLQALTLDQLRLAGKSTLWGWFYWKIRETSGVTMDDSPTVYGWFSQLEWRIRKTCCQSPPGAEATRIEQRASGGNPNVAGHFRPPPRLSG